MFVIVQRPIHCLSIVALLNLVVLSLGHTALVRSASRSRSLSLPTRPVADGQGTSLQTGLRPEVPSGTVTLTHAKDEASVSQICTMCAVMYGIIGVMWVVHRRFAPKGERSLSSYTALLCITWASTSVGMHVLNKGLASKLKAPALISAVQMIIAVVIVGSISYRQLLEAPRRQVLVWLLVPMFFSAMLCSSMYTYEYISLSLLTVVRNLTPLVVLPIETLVMPVQKRPRITPMVVGAILIMLSGALIYGGGVGNVSMVGIAFAVANMTLAASDRLIQRRLLTEECKDLPAAVCTTMNNAIGLVPTIALAFITHQVNDLGKPEKQAMWSDPAVWFLLLLSGCVGIGICYLGFECQRVISATSFFVLQNVSKVFVVAAGIFVYHDPLRSTWQVLGLLLSLGGSFLYGKTQMELAAQQENNLKAKAAPGAVDAVSEGHGAKPSFDASEQLERAKNT